MPLLLDLFQWDRFVTPSIVKVFYWLSTGLAGLFGLAGLASSFALMKTSFLAGLLMLAGSLIGAGAGVVVARIMSEVVLIVFRINEHLGMIRSRGML